MSFLEPLLLAGLPLIALPIVIHLLNRRRYQTVAWGAMMFLLQAARRSRKQSRLRHLLILAARMLAVAAMVFVIARPLASGWLGLFGGVPDTVIVVLDRSASMEHQNLQTGRSKRSTAMDQLIDTLQKTGTPPHLVLIDSGSSVPQQLESPLALSESPSTLGTDAAADIPTMLNVALEHVVTNQSGRTDVWICSDLQSEDWKPEAGQWAAVRAGFEERSRNVRFQLLAYRQVSDSNLSVRMERLERVTSDDTDVLVADIVVRSTDTERSQTVPLSVVIDGARTVIEVPLDRGRAVLKGYEIPLGGDRKSGWGKLELPNDTNQRDNQFYFTYGPSVPWKTVIVADQPEMVRPIALAAAPKISERALEATVIEADLFSSVDLASVALVVWQAALPEGSAAMQLQQFVAAGGVCIFLPSRAASSASLWDTRFGAWRQATGEGPWRVDQWRDDSGLLRNVDSGRALPVGELEIHAACLIESENLQTLARLVNGQPLLSRVPTDRGGVYFLSTLPALPDSNMAQQGIVLFAMVQRALESGADRLATSRLADVGGADMQVASEARRVSEDPPEPITRNASLSAGVYQTRGKLLAANRPPAEDHPRALTDDQLQELLSGLDYRVVHDDVQSGAPLIREIWKLFALLLIVALLVEALLCLPDMQATRTSNPRASWNPTGN